MKAICIYRVSFYLMLFFATLALSVDAPESRLSMLYPAARGGRRGRRLPDRRSVPALGLSRPWPTAWPS